MNYKDLYSPEEIQRLVAGEVITKTVTDGKSPTNKNKQKEVVSDDKPVATEAEKPKHYTPKVHVPINDRVDVTRPNIYDQQGKRISPDDVVGVSQGTFDRIDQDLFEAKQQIEAERAARKELQRIASPEMLLNRLNASQRVTEKLQKEVASLKRELTKLKGKDETP